MSTLTYTDQEVDLRQFDDEYRKIASEDAGLEPVPDGRYEAAVEDVHLTRSAHTGNPVLTFSLRILGPQAQNRMLWKRNGITANNLRFIKRDLSMCGLDLDPFSDLPRHMRRLIGVTLEINKRTRGENYDIYFNRRLDGSEPPPPPRRRAEAAALSDDDIPF